jgi:outer membrane lipoprotein-sorting protein
MAREAVTRVCAAALMFLPGFACASAPVPAQSLLAKLARTPPVSTPFVQVSYRGVLDRPLIVSGTLRWSGGDRLERDVEKPFREVAKISDDALSVRRGDGEVHTLPLARAPQIGALLAGFRALLGGDATALRQDFTLAAQGDDTHWVIMLAPRTDALKRQLQSIVIDGRAAEPRCLTVDDTNGDSSITLLGALARAGLPGDVPLESAVAALCRNGR